MMFLRGFLSIVGFFSGAYWLAQGIAIALGWMTLVDERLAQACALVALGLVTLNLAVELLGKSSK